METETDLIEKYLTMLNLAKLYIKNSGRTINECEFMAEVISKYKSSDNEDKNVLYEPDVISDDGNEIYLLYISKEMRNSELCSELYINDKHVYTCRYLLPLFEYLVNNECDKWYIIEA